MLRRCRGLAKSFVVVRNLRTVVSPVFRHSAAEKHTVWAKPLFFRTEHINGDELGKQHKLTEKPIVMTKRSSEQKIASCQHESSGGSLGAMKGLKSLLHHFLPARPREKR
jgi:hypothetical protein